MIAKPLGLSGRLCFLGMQVFVADVWASLEFIDLGCGSALQSSATTRELLKRLWGQSRSAMLYGGGVVNLMNRNGRVDNMTLKGLLLNDRLNVFVNVMVRVLSGHDWSSGRRVCRLVGNGAVPVLASVALQEGVHIPLVSMLVRLVLHRNGVVCVLLRPAWVSHLGRRRAEQTYGIRTKFPSW